MSAHVTDAERAAALGAGGRFRSVATCTAAQLDAAMRAIADVRPGTEFSVNLVRHHLDGHRVPEVARAGIFAHAVAAGLIEPVWIVVPGDMQPRTERSTGITARGARVRMYRRLHATYHPPAVESG